MHPTVCASFRLDPTENPLLAEMKFLTGCPLLPEFEATPCLELESGKGQQGGREGRRVQGKAAEVQEKPAEKCLEEQGVQRGRRSTESEEKTTGGSRRIEADRGESIIECSDVFGLKETLLFGRTAAVC